MLRPVLLALLILSRPLGAETVVPQSADAVTLSFAPVVHTTAPAVVNIYARGNRGDGRACSAPGRP